MDYSKNSFPNEESVLQELSHPRPNIINSNYASVYQVKYNSEFVFVYVQYQQQFPSFHELIAASKYFIQ